MRQRAITFFGKSQIYRQVAPAHSTHIGQFTIPRLPILEEMNQLLSQHPDMPDLSKTLIIGEQHILETTGSLIRNFSQKGMFIRFCDKFNTTSRLVAEKICLEPNVRLFLGNPPRRLGIASEAYRENIDRMLDFISHEIQSGNLPIKHIIVLGDGALTLKYLSDAIKRSGYPCAAVEQTTRGHRRIESGEISAQMPVVSVARSAVKLYLEPPLIARAVARKAIQLIDSLEPGVIYGIVGGGAIGSAIAQYLLLKDIDTVVTYDINDAGFKDVHDRESKHPRFKRLHSLQEVYQLSRYVFGCVGGNISPSLDTLNTLDHDLGLFSCSSDNGEYNSLLRHIGDHYHQDQDLDPLSDHSYQVSSGAWITVYNGGFPINHDRTPWNVPKNSFELIQTNIDSAVTLAALLAKPISFMPAASPQFYALDPYVQRWSVAKWWDKQPLGLYSAELRNRFRDIEWIWNYSEGNRHEHRLFSESLGGDHNLQSSPQLRR